MTNQQKLQRHQSYISRKWDENADNFSVSRYKRLTRCNRMILKRTFEVIDEIWDSVGA